MAPNAGVRESEFRRCLCDFASIDSVDLGDHGLGGQHLSEKCADQFVVTRWASGNLMSCGVADEEEPEARGRAEDRRLGNTGSRWGMEIRS
jgi:hypothetical protein